ncbi:MAG: hypothetical protein ACN6O2_03665 [Stenotrophomonas sp.]|uniref:hypothetical protein n=1 Tax=Stenotrophomonas sp. TaxID=69392 RepID=UPI0028ACF0F3|nr:hypothetical protein [Stenotrophomonas sp.]
MTRLQRNAGVLPGSLHRLCYSQGRQERLQHGAADMKPRRLSKRNIILIGVAIIALVLIMSIAPW